MDFEPEGHRGLAPDPTASVWQSWDLNPGRNLRAIALAVPSYWSSERQDREEIKHGERDRGRQGARESEKA